MRKRGFFTDVEGDLHVLIPLYDDLARPSDMTDEEYFEFARDKMLISMNMPNDTVVGEFDERDAPTDRTFRHAWEATADGIQVSMPKARGIQMDKIREVRNKELTALDVPFMKALEDGDTDAQATIKTKKQELRNIPQTFDLTTDTPEELKIKWPEGLPKE